MEFEVSQFARDKDGNKTKYYKKGFIDENNNIHIIEEKGRNPKLKQFYNDYRLPKRTNKYFFSKEDTKFIEEYEKKLKNENESQKVMKMLLNVKSNIKSKMESTLSEVLLTDFKTVCSLYNELQTFQRLTKESMVILNKLVEMYGN